jgi:hypothetical protein
MSTMTHQLILRLFAFSLGVCVGSLVIPNTKLINGVPVHTDFCFLARNPDLFESRRFISFAYISSAQPHGFVLDNPSCPDEIVSFGKQLDRQDHIQELDERFRRDPYASVPILFEGTLHRPSFVRNALFAVRSRLGLPGDLNRTITIRAYKAVGEHKWDSKKQTWNPVSP